MNPGAVEFQRQLVYCPGCGGVVTHVRAVRLMDRWHSDWTCLALVKAGQHKTPRGRKRR